MRHCCLSSGRNTPFTTPFLIHLETVARSTFSSFATSEAFKKAFIQLQYKLSKKLSRGQTVASVAITEHEGGASRWVREVLPAPVSFAFWPSSEFNFGVAYAVSLLGIMAFNP